jgi:hypothetical protein
MRTAPGPYASGGHLEKPVAENGPMLRAAQHADEPRESRLRRQSVGHDRVLRQRLVVVAAPPGLQRPGPPSIGHREPERRVVVERIGVVLITPALPQQQERRTHQFRERVRDELGLARIDEPLDQPLDDAHPPHHFPQDDGPSLCRQALGTAFDAQRAIEIDAERSRILGHDAPFWAWGGVSQLLPITLS